MSAAAYRSRAGRARCIPAFLWQVLVCQLILLSRIAWAFFQKLRPICKVKITHTYTSKLNWKEVIIGRRRNVSVRVLFWRNFHKNFVLYHKYKNKKDWTKKFKRGTHWTRAIRDVRPPPTFDMDTEWDLIQNPDRNPYNLSFNFIWGSLS